MDINSRISEDIREIMKNEIENAGGNEVFFRGVLNEEKIVSEIEVIARGNINSVPAILNRMKPKEVVMHNHPSGYLYPSDNDVQIASLYGNIGGGFYIVNNNVTDVYAVVEPESNVTKKIDINGYFEETGLLSKEFSEFEYRHEQYDMAKVIETGLNEGKKTVIEAGTGTGKTLAYLIPTLEWGLANKKPVVISTNTINLQEQLINKDIPITKKVLSKNFKIALVKGRGNYLCVRKMKNIKLADFDEEEKNFKTEFQEVIEWARHTETGDRQELKFEVSYNVWERVASESDMCLKNKCPYRDKCFFLKARKNLLDADLLITNHHIYFADLAIRKESGFRTEYAILPSYEAIVFDEAHNIEKVARDYFSFEISKYSFNKILNSIYTYKGKNRDTGSILKALVYLRNEGVNKETIKELNDLYDLKILDKHKHLYEKANDFFLKMVMIYGGNEEKRENKIRLIPELLKKDYVWNDEVLLRAKDVANTYAGYLRHISKFQKIIVDLELDDDFGFLNDFFRYTERLKEFFKTFDFIMKMEEEGYVYWIEINSKKSNLKVIATPLKIEEQLNEVLYDNLDNIIFTSATLAVGNSFDYFKKSIGLREDTNEKIIESPFDYEKQMKLLIPSDVELPNSITFIDNIKQFIIDLIKKTGGNTFLLFTSYSSLNYIYYQIRKDLEKENFRLLIQGAAPRHQLLEMYKFSEKPVLFGTDSFWEGVDVKGEKLSSVIIMKLPFKVPTDPVVQAIIENLEKEGKNSFMEYQIPEAIIKFKQGVGRLIRSKQDTGLITVVDVRIIKKRYGKLFLDSLPKTDIKIDKRENLLTLI